MPQVTFHFNVSDPVDYACRLARKVRARNLRLVVCADPHDVADMDQRLWTLTPLSFVSHAAAGAPERVLARSPVQLCSDLTDRFTGDVLVNLRVEMPPSVGRFARLVEIVPLDEPSRAAARHRWRGYVAQGIAPERHDAAAFVAP